ncbi:MAG: metal ABC transporter substrate-binding protein [Deltaproteobacteria bacterium]|nr:metal ABC transporter substrate-binding protein [Deltaproteobacteria bacterium]
MKRPGSLFLAIAAGCWISVLSAFAGAQSVNIVTSVIPVAYIVEELGGDRVEVAALVPPGASPHTFEPVPSNVRKLARARYFVGIGGEFDAFSERLLAAAPKGIEAVALSKAPNLNLLEGEEHHHHHGEQRAAEKDHHHHGEEKAAKKDEHHHDHGEGKVAREGGEEHGEFDPHFWLDPIRVRDAVAPVVTQRLIAADPAGKDYYEKRRQDFHRRLTALDQQIRAELAKAKTRKYIAFHAAWAYFADRYGLEKVAVVQEFAGEEPTPKEVARLVRDARAEGVGTVLVEPQLNPRVAQTIGKEFGARTVMTDPLGDPGDAARDTYEELMQFNARAFGQALQRSLN